MGLKAETHTNYSTRSSGEAVSDDIGIGAAVAVTATRNTTQATLGSGNTVSEAKDINVTAQAEQNRDGRFASADMAAEAVSGASGGEVAVAGALAVVLNENETRASIDEGALIGTALKPVGHVTVQADETTHLAAQARAGALAKGSQGQGGQGGGEAKAGVGASFAVLMARGYACKLSDGGRHQASHRHEGAKFCRCEEPQTGGL